MKSRKNTGRFAGKGYYIALVLCAVAIGISGYLYYRNVQDNDPQLQDPASTVDAGNDVPVIATDPSGNGATVPTTPDSGKKPIKTGLPVSGETVSGYAMDVLSYNETTRDWRVHNGIDIAAQAGTTVNAAADGTVYTVFNDDSMGMTVVIRHENGYTTTYSSLASDVKVAAGDQVTLGQTIGTVANTAMVESAIGDHLHFSVTRNDEPMDPAEFFSLK